MRILHVVGDSNPAMGGAIEGVFQLGDAYRAMGHVQELLTLDAPDDPWVAAAPSPVHALGHQRTEAPGALGQWAEKLRPPTQAISWLRTNLANYDAVVVDGLWNTSTLTARWVLPRAGVPYAVFSHGMLDPYFRTTQPGKEWIKRQLFRVNERVLLRGAEAALFTTQQERDLAIEAWPGWKKIESEVVGFGTGEPPVRSPAMAAAFAEAVPDAAGEPYLLFLSRLHPKKGCEILLEAFATADLPANLRLVMAGPGDAGYVTKLRAQAEALGIGARTDWPRMLSGNAKWGALYGCEAMALISHQENFGVVVAEALACARPVVISDQVNLHGTISAAGSGIVCDNNAPSAREALATIMAMSREDRTAMGQAGRTQFDREFAMRRTAERILALFERSQNESTNNG
ncbi:glycosyltransferase [Parerythrobacter jejuensis]|uniref:Glycosyltransferase n=1 Tax=Parerythrobacter jejuensis TaxID=795812 RepID=A0A845AWC7_9SPHN|nr:glycosyltransferase [Parerythrobacter jejuensis]MXP31098.1 glycosyltransferase [Parerythrobacter jejuensis]MXP33858.1 glycosyltransferase [Parerythrobacter jejuensis]